MNLLDLLMGSMGSQDSVNALSQNTGISDNKTSLLLKLALPLLLKYLTQNASSQSGAQSLANALTQHTDTSSMAQQFGNADIQDGNAIVQHILGNDSNQVVNALSQQSDVGSDQVMNLLGNMAPGLLSGLSAATSSAQQGQQAGGFDFSGLMNAFGGMSQGAQLQEIPADSSSNGTDLLSSLMGLTGGQGF